MIWAIIGMSAGAYLASELVMPWLNFDIAQITFGRLRPFHTNAVIFVDMKPNSEQPIKIPRS
jgi:cytochrome c oxidase cbb3-type subunit 1